MPIMVDDIRENLDPDLDYTEAHTTAPVAPATGRQPGELDYADLRAVHAAQVRRYEASQRRLRRAQTLLREGMARLENLEPGWDERLDHWRMRTGHTHTVTQDFHDALLITTALFDGALTTIREEED